VGRAAAIAAAAIAGIASLPALLGGEEPPPVPPDVGLAALPASIGAPAKADPSRSGKLFRHTRRNFPKRASGHGRQHRRQRRSPQHSHVRLRHAHPPGMAPSSPVPAQPAPSPPAYSYVPPSSPGEFRFER